MIKTLYKYVRAQWPKLLLITIWGIVCFAFFQSKMHYHFFYQEQNQLFLNDSEYLCGYFRKPAWLACIIGDWLTQFYYYLFAGPAILTIVLMTLGDIVRRVIEHMTANTSKIVGWMAFIIALAFITWQARLCLDENYPLASLIALTGALALWICHDMLHGTLKNRWLRVIGFAIIIPVAYWCFGFGMFAVLLPEIVKVGVMTFNLTKTNTKTKTVTVILTLLVAALPMTVKPTVARYYHFSEKKATHYPGTGNWMDIEYAKTFENVLSLDNEYYWGHYNKVVGLYNTMEGDKNDQMAFFYCLSLAKMGMLPEYLPNIDNPYLGTFLSIGEDTPMYSIMMINELYYLIGDMTYAERAALLANTFSPRGVNARMIKRLAETNLVKGDEKAAMKYLRMLSKSCVYRQWAKNHTPGTMTPEVEAEIAHKREFINTNDDIRLGDNCYTILTQLLDSNPKNTVALHYLLCSDMLSGQKDVFVNDYERYGNGGKSLFDQIYKQTKQQ